MDRDRYTFTFTLVPLGKHYDHTFLPLHWHRPPLHLLGPRWKWRLSKVFYHDSFICISGLHQGCTFTPTSYTLISVTWHSIKCEVCNGLTSALSLSQLLSSANLLSASCNLRCSFRVTNSRLINYTVWLWKNSEVLRYKTKFSILSTCCCGYWHVISFLDSNVDYRSQRHFFQILLISAVHPLVYDSG